MHANSDAIQERARRALQVPLLRFLGAIPLDEHDATTGIRLTVTRNTLNAAGRLHGGGIATLLDVAAYLAVLQHLALDEEATTHSFAASYLAAVPVNEQLKVSGRILRRGQHVAFAAADVRSANELIATAQVTKSIRKRA